MRDYLEEACEQIDAAMYSGDAFDDPEHRKELREYMERWNRELETKESYNQYKTSCPDCKAKGSLIVTEAFVAGTGKVEILNSRLQSDGFEVNVDEDIKDCSTEEEKVLCTKCGAKFELCDLMNEE